MKKYIENLILKKEQLNAYYNNSIDEIKLTNIKIFKILTIVTSISIVFFMGLTKLVYKEWMPSLYHYIFLGLAVVFMFISFYLNEHRRLKMEKYIFALSMLIIAVFLCVLDTVPFPGESAIFMGMFILIAPILFIVNFLEMAVFQTLYLTLFLVMTFYFKDVDLAMKDFLEGVLAYVISYVVYFINMSVRIQQYLEKNRYRLSAERDPLTGILNRASAQKGIDSYLEKKNEEDTCAMFMLDVDDFKNINDTLGHASGDKVIKEIAHILSIVFRKNDLVARFGGDEFSIFIYDFDDIQFLNEKCAEIERKVKCIMEGRFDFSCSIGVCVLENGTATLDEMFKVADDALYEAKALSKGNYIIHEYKNGRVMEKLPLMVIVDDSKIDRETIAAQFENEYKIEKFESGNEGLNFIVSHAKEISIVLLDNMMPEISGVDLLKTMKNKLETSRIPVIIVSADEMSEEESLKCGADDMITKPIIPAITKLRVKNAVNKRR